MLVLACDSNRKNNTDPGCSRFSILPHAHVDRQMYTYERAHTQHTHSQTDRQTDTHVEWNLPRIFGRISLKTNEARQNLWFFYHVLTSEFIKRGSTA